MYLLVIPFIENVNTVIGFAKHVKSVYDFFLGKSEKKPEVTLADYKDLSQIINPVANDSGSQFNMSTTVNGDVHLHLHLSSIESNAIQNVLNTTQRLLKAQEVEDEIQTRVLLTWYQARNDMKSSVGNKGTIESLSNKPMNIVFDNDELKDKMLHGENPFTTVFVVDVKMQTVNGKLAAFKVVKLHETFEVNSDA